MMHYLSMGGYGRYLWPCYLLALLVFVVNIVAARRSLRAAQQLARRRLESRV